MKNSQKMKNKKKIRKDPFISKIFESKIILFLLGGFTLFAYILDSSILNNEETVSLFIIRYIVAFLLIIFFLWFRYKKYTDYYCSILKDKIYFIASVLLIISYTFWGQYLISIPVNMVIKSKAINSPIEIYDCEITPIRLNKSIPNIRYLFLNHEYSARINHRGISDEDLDSLYLLEISVRKSLCGTYCVESYKLKRRPITGSH